MSGIVKAYVLKPSPLKEWREAALSEVRRVDRRSCAGGEDEPLILVAISEHFSFQ